jgi:hypothetical protein
MDRIHKYFRFQREPQVGPLETRLADLAGDLLIFLQQKAPIMTNLPTRYRRRYEDRIRELVARARCELEEYQKVLEAESRCRRKKSRLTRIQHPDVQPNAH